MAERATCWSITINNPQEIEYKVELPAGWSLEGQLERGEEGTLHYQGCLKTNQVRFSAVKKIFPRAHIQVARNRAALEKYVHKEESRVEKVETNFSRIPTLFEYEDIIAKKWDESEFQRRWEAAIEETPLPTLDEVAMRYLDSLVAADIESGRRGAEWHAVNPAWRAAWRKFWRSIIKRNALAPSLPPPSSSFADGPSGPSSDGSSSSCSPQGAGSEDALF